MKSTEKLIITLFLITICLSTYGIIGMNTHIRDTQQSILIFMDKMMHEYQVEIDMDTVYVYQNGRYVDCYIVGDELNQFDEIMAIDNQ